MDVPTRYGRLAGPPPAIHIHETSNRSTIPTRRSSPNHAKFTGFSPAVSPMSIPNAREEPPPALPPPKNIPGLATGSTDLAWEFANQHKGSQFRKALIPCSSLCGGNMHGSTFDQPEPESYQNSHSITRTNTSYPRFDEGYESMRSINGTSVSFDRSKDSRFAELPTANPRRFQAHDSYQFQAMSRDYDKEMLSKLDLRRNSDNTTPPLFRGMPMFGFSSHEVSPTSRIALEHRQTTQLKPLSFPRSSSRSPIENTASLWLEPASVTSPLNSYSQQCDAYRSLNETQAPYWSPLTYIRRSGSSSASVDDTSSFPSRFRDANDHRISPKQSEDFQEDAELQRLQIDDYHSIGSPTMTAGQKRRASSPPGDECPSLHNVSSSSDLFRRRESIPRSSPGPRFHSNSGSVSSTSSMPRKNSHTSTLSVAASSNTSSGSYGRLSPGGLSSGGPESHDSPRAISHSLNPSPRGSISRPSNLHPTLSSDTRPFGNTPRVPLDSAVFTKHSNVSKFQGLHMCECCPKKPKKFDTAAELSAHEQEKQYECSYCRNRFKNKNEAERHQNSLHLRRHSWSCAALSGYPAAFHNSPTKPDKADTCGYCGEDFPRSGFASAVYVATEQDWGLRIRHLTDKHKFGECNHAKKFFRADHFRQHLKHSHAGTSGKWTNILENACMKDEPLPEPNRGPERANPTGARVSRISEEDEMR